MTEAGGGEKAAPVGDSARRRSRTIDWSVLAEPQPYNPLSKVNLGRSVEAELLRSPTHPLAAVPPFLGAGIYAIYYGGNEELYQPLSGSQTPIYVGKAVPAGARKGLITPGRLEHQLWDRLDEHRGSVEAATDLDVADFRARYLVADELFIPMAERLMIQGFQPVWNLIVDGFGNHNPGAGRHAGRRPPWDELHPGREWSQRMTQPSSHTAEASAERVRAHFERNPPARADALPGGLPDVRLRADEVPDSALDAGSLPLFDQDDTSPEDGS